ncbi:hypothetical protein Glove_137g79 [Diversispora epigaea]|uniref:SAM domain-containing protein n=1 Tax=Diversispora epigaea TaxID=1348612 RepID=A0A397IYZ9_9GLOM|nr:hypothetical protein Glove_137g79 [Diversispora epigaea]
MKVFDTNNFCKYYIYVEVGCSLRKSTDQEQQSETLPHICITYKSTISEQSSLASASTINEEKPTPILVEVVRKYNTEQLIQFLCKRKELQLNDTHFETICNEEITGRDFLNTTEQRFRSYGMKSGQASRLADFAKKIKEKATVTYS